MWPNPQFPETIRSFSLKKFSQHKKSIKIAFLFCLPNSFLSVFSCLYHFFYKWLVCSLYECSLNRQIGNFWVYPGLFPSVVFLNQDLSLMKSSNKDCFTLQIFMLPIFFDEIFSIYWKREQRNILIDFNITVCFGFFYMMA